LAILSRTSNLVLDHAAIILRLKIMAKLNVSEKRRPQDGVIASRSGDTAIDIRVSPSPISYDKGINLRVLNLSEALVYMEGMGPSQKHLDQIFNVIPCPYGIVLVPDLTGSGKPTMLNACMHVIRDPEICVIAIEDA
jgi:type II secretory ATPase GspE/PulE/Tfp pilus assembly ATPase PilB-like protein